MHTYNVLVFDSEVIQISLKAVLGGEAGVHKEAFFVIPFFETAVVEQFQVVLDDEGDNIMLEALFEEDQAATLYMVRVIGHTTEAGPEHIMLSLIGQDKRVTNTNLFSFQSVYSFYNSGLSTNSAMGASFAPSESNTMRVFFPSFRTDFGTNKVF